MKYNLHINQKAILDNGYDLDVYEAIILDFISDFATSKKVEKIYKNGCMYMWISYSMIVNELPMLKIKKDTAYRKMKNLCDKGFLRHLNEGAGAVKAFYELTEKAESLRYGFLSEGTDFHPREVRIPIRGGTDEHPYYNNNKYNNTIDNIIDTPHEKNFETDSTKNDSEEKEKSCAKKEKEDRDLKFRDRVKSTVSEKKIEISDVEINKFCNYWTESSEKQIKMRFEKQDAFDISKRLATWIGNIKRDYPSNKHQRNFEKTVNTSLD